MQGDRGRKAPIVYHQEVAIVRQYLNTTGKLVFLSLTFSITWISSSVAQIVPDGTLGAESSIVTPVNAFSDQIDGGALRGSNLFHSFQDFNIDDDRGAYFSNPTGIENILTRVTGGNPSNIFGTLGVLGNANLFLINPNGIVFGPNARLDVGGSFFASTAEGITFLDGYQFSATNPDVLPLLTINVPIGLQFGANPGGIVNQSVATQVIDGEESIVGLQVPPGRTLGLVGGNLLFDEGWTDSPESQVELAALAAPGAVGLNPDGSLSVPLDVPRADVAIQNASIVNVAWNNGGSISIYARNLDISGSLLFAGIQGEMGSLDSKAGNINIYTTGEISLKQGLITNNIGRDSLGNGGDINIQTGSLSVTEGAQLSASIFGQGNAGNINITATETVSFEGRVSLFEGDSNRNSGAFSIVDDEAVGNGGDINIQTRSLFVTEGARLIATTLGEGNAGNINIRAIETVSFEGEKDGLRSGAFSRIETEAIGEGGEINIQTRNLFVTEGAQLSASTFGQGNAGSINIIAAEMVAFDGERSGLFSEVFSRVEAGAVGDAGDVNIQTGSLSVTNGAQVSSGSFGQGNAGSVNITATNTVSLGGEKGRNGGAFSNVEPGAVGDGGDINIQTRSLFVTEGTQLLANMRGQGNAGSINITATETVSFDGQRNGFPSSAFSSVGETVGIESVGDGGEINIQAGSLFVTEGAQLGVSTYGQGNAGRINITATDTVSFDGQKNGFPSIASSSVEPGALGNGGDINILTRNLFVTEGAQLVVGTEGQGNAGNVNIAATETVSFEGETNGISSAVFSSVSSGAMGDGGEINIQTGSLLVTNGAELSASTFGQGNAGSINIIATETVSFEAESNSSLTGTFSSVESGAIGNGGDINIQTGNLSVTDGALLFASTFGQGHAGSINITATETVSFDGKRNGFPSGAFSTVEAGGLGNGGNIQIDGSQVFVTNGAQLQTLLRRANNDLLGGRGNAGNINIQASEIVSFDGFSSGALSNVDPGAVGDGGNITVQTESLSLSNGAGLTASNRGVGAAGSIDLEANSIRLDRQATLNADTFAGNEGNITVRSSALFLRNQSRITTDARGTSTGGNITINSDVIAALENSDISANAQAAFGGRVTIDTQGLFGTAFRERLTPQSDITATSALGPDFSGTVEITPPEVDPASGVVSLPESPVDADSLFGKDFCSQRGTSQFIFTGRGGIPPSPFEPLGGSSPIELDWVEAPETLNTEEPESRREISSPVNRPLIEAQGWVIEPDGTIVLTAQPHRGTPAPPALSHPDCQHLNLNAQ